MEALLFGVAGDNKEKPASCSFTVVALFLLFVAGVEVVARCRPVLDIVATRLPPAAMVIRL